MANTLITPQIVAIEALRILQSNMVFRDLVYNDYASDFAQVGDTVNVRKRAALGSKLFDGQIVIQDLQETTIPVKLDRLRDTSVKVTSKEMTLDIKDFSKQIMEPALIGLAQDVDADIAAAAVGYASYTKAATANPTNLADIADLAKRLDKVKAPKTDRVLVLSPDHKYKYALTGNLSNVSYAGDNVTLREALLGKVYGFATYMSQNLSASEAATPGTATTYKVAGTKGQDTVALSSVDAATGTIKTGDGFIVDGRLYRFTADGTAASGSVASIKIDKKLHKNITATEKVTLVNGVNSVAFQKEGIAFVTRPLELPMGAAKAYVAQAENIAVRVVFDYNVTTKEDTISFDVLYGIAELNKDLIARLA